MALFIATFVLIALSLLAPMRGIAEISRIRVQFTWQAMAVPALGIVFRRT